MYYVLYYENVFAHNTYRLHCTKQLFMAAWKLFNTLWPTTPTSMLKMQTDGPHCITRVRRYVKHIIAAVYFLNCTMQGYLDIVRWLCEKGGAAAELDGAPGVDARSKGGWTPLSEQITLSSGSPLDLLPLQ